MRRTTLTFYYSSVSADSCTELLLSFRRYGKKNSNRSSDLRSPMSLVTNGKTVTDMAPISFEIEYNNTSVIFFKFYCFYIYSHVYTLFVPPPPEMSIIEQKLDMQLF
jgi:hypothetical protein